METTQVSVEEDLSCLGGMKEGDKSTADNLSKLNSFVILKGVSVNNKEITFQSGRERKKSGHAIKKLKNTEDKTDSSPVTESSLSNALTF